MTNSGARLWLGLVLCGAMLAGCSQVVISQSPNKGATLEHGTTARPQHDVAVLGAEISPPLDGAIRLTEGRANFQLLVAVENRGTQPARDVIVEAWLKAPGDKADGAIVTGRTIVPYLAPGEVGLARLSQAAAVPVLPSYVLVVSARPVPLETNVANNTSRYEVSVTLPLF